MDSTEKESTGGVGELVKAWGTPLAITTSLAILQQLTGNGNILNYTAAIFHMAKVNGPAPVVMLGVVKVLATMVAILKVYYTPCHSCHVYLEFCLASGASSRNKDHLETVVQAGGSSLEASTRNMILLVF